MNTVFIQCILYIYIISNPKVLIENFTRLMREILQQEFVSHSAHNKIYIQF